MSLNTRSDQLTVACVLWQGDFRGRKYTAEWVEKLRSMVSRNLERPHRFVCFSNIDVPCEKIPLRRGWPGWWSKIELFDPDNGLEGRVLYIDLDVVITGALEPFVDFPAPFAITPARPPFDEGTGSRRKGKIIVRRFNSSVVVWDVPYPNAIFRYFSLDAKDAMESYRGDQDWIAHVVPEAETFPEAWVRKLRYCPDGPPEECKVVLVMPGKNEKASERYRWIKKLWR